jgi:hypothetical protein
VSFSCVSSEQTELPQKLRLIPKTKALGSLGAVQAT